MVLEIRTQRLGEFLNGYSTERKRAVLCKLLPQHNRTVADSAKEESVSTFANYQWTKAAPAKRYLVAENNAEPAGWTTQDQFDAVLKPASLAESNSGTAMRSRIE
ncbi:hypothetical protein GH984_07305 [Spiribacter sp. C176]|uniref:Uncharacterized protein n=1 Tax=Spiribacter salilacus TaxID=2664894 RepID=A0A6N7QQ23_9GAMM|nr:hypothetical protein [Spiribacter salilacus]MRH78511.1 hypothetical protein [Spiribacter salilacus]